MLDVKIRKGTFKHIESELFAYHDTKKEINNLKNDIIHSSPNIDENVGGRNNLPSDPTGSTAALLLSHKKIEQLIKIIEAIDKVYKRLPSEKQKLIRIKYWTKPQILTWEGIAQQLNISRRQAIYWRDEIVYAIANELGWR